MIEETPHLRAPTRFYDGAYQRPVRSRYVDPVEVIWLATARRHGLTVRRHPEIFSMTEGDGIVHLGPRKDLDEDDTLAQMLFHELCHWITNGLETQHERDWGYPVDGRLQPHEHACLRLQAWWSGRHGLREMFGPTGEHRQYYDQLPDDPLVPIDDSAWEAEAVRLAKRGVERAQGAPWWAPIEAAMTATRALRDTIEPFIDDYRTEHPDDDLPLMWAQRHTATDR